MNKIIGIIPARYASTRFPGKPLALIMGKPMIQRVYERAKTAADLDEVYVATENSRIEKAVLSFGGRAIMTSDKHKTGTDRCYEAAEKIRKEGADFDIVVNIQGDEPYIQTDHIAEISTAFKDPGVQIATLVKKIENQQELFDPSVVKVVFNRNFNARYFSRQTIPYLRNEEKDSWLTKFTFYKHIGIYAYRFDTLRSITSLSQSRLEVAESLEQLRWIDNGYSIRVTITEKESLSVDTPEDLSKFLNNT